MGAVACEAGEGRKTTSPKYFMTNEHNSENDEVDE